MQTAKPFTRPSRRSVFPNAVPCPICGSTDVEEVLEMRDVPVNAGILHYTPEAARGVQRGDIILSFCRKCTCIWNRSFDVDLTDYSAAYDCSLHHSPTYEEFLHQTADSLVHRYTLRNGTVAEVGCGEGHFLRVLCSRADCDGIGIDPSGPEGEERVGTHTIRFIKEPLGDQHLGIEADLVVSRQMLIYVPDPLEMARRMRQLGRFHYVEIPNAEFYFKTATVWAIYYENIYYFSSTALGKILAAAGLNVNVRSCYIDGQYLVAETSQSEEPATHPVHPEFVASVRALRDAFSAATRSWRSRLQGQDLSRVVVWGAAGRGTMFVNVLDPACRIRAVVDNNPARIDTYIAGTGHAVVGANSLTEIRPELIILTNPTYEDEIRSQVTALGLNPQFAVA